MSEPTAVPAHDGTVQARPGVSPRRVLAWALVALVGYGLILFLFSDTLYLLAVPGAFGLVFSVIMGVVSVLHRSFDAVPYATGSVNAPEAVRYHYAATRKRYFVLAVIGGGLVAVPLVAGVPYLYPLVGVGGVGLLLATLMALAQVSLIRKCAQVLQAYGFEFRAPVNPIMVERRGTRRLRIGEGPGRSPKMAARAPILSEHWPPGIADGVWFAGDDPFGGVLIVPGSGAMMFLQPRNWRAHRNDRTHAGAERTAKAERAKLHRRRV